MSQLPKALAVERLVDTLRMLQDLMRKRIDPEGTMTAAQFEDVALSLIDEESVNEALDAIEAQDVTRH